MKRYARFLTSLYGRLLVLYPRRYRREYGDELRTVFGSAAEEAAKEGLASLLRFSLHELRDLPLAALHQHMKERKRSKAATDTGDLIAFKPASWREISLAAAPFLYFGLVYYLLTQGLLVGRPQWIDDVATFGMLALLVGLFLVGLIKGFPYWSLPTLGLLFVFLLFRILHQWSAMLPILIPIKPWHPVWLRQFIYWIRMKADIMRAGLFILGTAIVLIRLTPFYKHLKQDWTRLSFTLYGSALFFLVLTFDEYRREEPYVLVASIFLAAGAFAYLKYERSWQRLLALLAGLMLAMAVAAVGKGILVSSPNWHWPNHQPSWEREVIITIYGWVFLMLAIFVPALFMRLLLFSREHLNYR